MAINNDEKILALKKNIAEKTIELNKSKKLEYRTNLVLHFLGKNLNTLNKEELEQLAIQINMYLMSAKQLKFEYVLYSGYILEDWLHDINNKLIAINLKNEQFKLTQMQTRLEQMLSEDKRVELELAELEKSLGI